MSEGELEGLFEVFFEPGDTGGTACEEDAFAEDLGGEFRRSLIEDVHDHLDDVVHEREHGVAHIRGGDGNAPGRAVSASAGHGVATLVVEIERERGGLYLFHGIVAELDPVSGVHRVDDGGVEGVARDVDGDPAGYPAVGDGGDLGLSPADVEEEPAYAPRTRGGKGALPPE